MSKALIIPAAGSGSRMQKQVPKPYLKLEGRTILEHTMRAFLPLAGLQQVVIAADDGYLDEVHRLLDSVLPDSIDGKVVAGGDERQFSIRNALDCVVDADLVLVHDAVRPFVKLEYIRQCCRVAGKNGAAVLGIPVRDTIKRVDDRQYVQETPSRSHLWQAQTPQVFKAKILREAYSWALKKGFTGTDDASLVEYLGKPVQMVRGDQANIKLTYPMDLELAELIMAKDG